MTGIAQILYWKQNREVCECGILQETKSDSLRKLFSFRLFILKTQHHDLPKQDTRGALMHRLKGAEAQGPTLERGHTGCREIIFFE